MKNTTFEAIVKYNDMVGSVSVDKSDQMSIYKWLDDRNLRESLQELVIGIQLHPDENNGEELVNPVNVTILLLAGENIDTLKEKISNNLTLQVRRIDTRMTLPEFFSLFKRFSLTLSWNENKNETKGSKFKGLLDGVGYQYE